MNDQADPSSDRNDRRRPADDRGRPLRDSRPQRDGDSRPQRSGDSRPPRSGDSRPQRSGDSRPQRGGDSRPQRGGDSRPQRGGDSRPQRGGDSRPSRGGDSRPSRDSDRRPPRDGDRRPARDGDRRPPQRDGERRFGDRDARPPRDGDRRPPRDGDRRPPRDGDRRPPQRDGERRFGDRDARPPRDIDRRPPRDGDRRPPRDGDRRPPQRDGERRFGDRDSRPQPERKPLRPGDTGYRADGTDGRLERDTDRRPPQRDGGDRFGRDDQRRRDTQRDRNQGPQRDAARPGRDFEHRGEGSGESFKQVREDDFVSPPLPDDVVAEDLDIGARMQLKTLTKDNAEYVAKHMAMASRYIDEKPELAHQHALTAARRAGRIGVVRETLAITAYQLGDFSLALRELRTYRRITGRDDQLPLMADCERGLGRPEKALELARSVEASSLETPVRVELAIVKSGARLDLGQAEAALEELRIPELRKDKAFEYSPALFASYAGVLEELGRDDEAAEWMGLAERAIDALEDAMAPGELEEVTILTEHIESNAVEAEVEAPAAEQPAPHGDALFGDALFGDELTDEPADERRDDER